MSISLSSFVSYGEGRYCVRTFRKDLLQEEKKSHFNDKKRYISKLRSEYKTREKEERKEKIKKRVIYLSELASYIDHTLLKPEAISPSIKRLIDDAIKFGFKAICINACHLPQVKQILEQERVEEKPLIVTVIGFPLGANITSTKVHEAIESYKAGADELDMVINIGLLKERDYEGVQSDIKQVVDAVPIPIKVILETGLLTPQEISIASKLVEAAQAHFVKTSTGFLGGGATVENIKIIKNAISSETKIKASGGIRDLSTALKMLEAGADRLGLSSSVQIMKDRKKLLDNLLDPK